MTRRTPPQKRIDDRRFPVVAYFRVPELGLVSLPTDPHQWLHRHVGAGQYAWHAAGRMSRDVFAVYFRRVSDLVAFVAAHPGLALADDVDL